MKILQLYALSFACLVGLVGLHPCFAGGIKPKELEQLKTKLPPGFDKKLLDNFVENIDGIRSWVANDIISSTSVELKSTESCKLCTSLIGLVVGIIRLGGELGFFIVKQLLLAICDVVLDQILGVLTYEVCVGVVELYADPLRHILTQKDEELKALDLCGIYTGTEGGCDPISDHLTNWEITINNNKPDWNEPEPLPEDVETVRILHLTDIHPDLHYVVNSSKTCTEPMCCRGAPVIDESLQAGPHGDFMCDMPQSAMDELLESAARNYDGNYSFVLMTGDLVHHAIWKTNQRDNIDHFNSVNNALNNLFSGTGVNIYPVIGNHEPHPCNMFPPSSIWGQGYNISWVYDSLADAYSQYLTPDAEVTLRAKGYYTLNITERLRLIAINTNFCYINNFWLFFDTRDPEGQLQWLADTLQYAEELGQVVYIAGHIPPGKSDCWNVWNSKFQDITIRYEAIIKAQFYGHTHNDETTIFFDKSQDPPRPANSLNIGVSTTAYTKLNPGYKVFFADGARDDATWEMVDHETWIYDLAEANANGPDAHPAWKRLYTMKEAFGLNSLRPTDLYDLVLRMLVDDSLFQEYYRFFHKDSNLREPCETNLCKMTRLCEIVKADSGDFSHCARLYEIAEGTTPPWPTEATTEGRGDDDDEGFAMTSATANIFLTTFIAFFLLIVN